MRGNTIELCFGNVQASTGGFVIIIPCCNYYIKTAVSCRAQCLLPPAVEMTSQTVQSLYCIYSACFSSCLSNYSGIRGHSLERHVYYFISK